MTSVVADYDPPSRKMTPRLGKMTPRLGQPGDTDSLPKDGDPAPVSYDADGVNFYLRLGAIGGCQVNHSIFVHVYINSTPFHICICGVGGPCVFLSI